MVVDTAVIETRLQTLDDYLNDLRPLQKVPLSSYLDDRRAQAVAERRLPLCAEAFSQAIFDRFIADQPS